MQRWSVWQCAWLVLMTISQRPNAGHAADAPAKADYERDVRPVLEHHCYKCHGPEKQQGGVRLDNRVSQLRPADSGSRPIVPGKASESELIRRVEATDSSE